jgi:two-component system, cell cycle sensor histidine kinase and response regulator CckA
MKESLIQTGSLAQPDQRTRVTDRTLAGVLIVDDNATKRLALTAALARLELPIVEADSGQAALRCVREQDFAVILLDVRMPDIDGFETAALIRSRKESEMTPIIFITSFTGDEIDPKAKYVSGAVDFMFAPVQADELRAKVSVFVKLHVQAVTNARKAQEVQVTADHLKLLSDAAPIGIFRTDADNKFVYTNPRWSEISGVSWQDALGRDWESIIASEKSPGVPFQEIAGVAATGSLGLRFEMSPPGSPSRIVLSTSEAIHDEGSTEITGWVGTLADVTAETRAEEERSRFQSLVQNSRDVIAVVDSTGRCSYVSPGVYELSGFTSEELIGSMAFDYVHPDDLETMSEYMTELASAPDANKAIEIRIRNRAQQWIWIEIRAVNRLNDPSIKGIVLNYHDITTRREAGNRLAQSELLLAEGQAVSHVGSFTGDMRTGELSWSDEQYRLLGFEPGSVEASFETLMGQIHPDDRAKFWQLTEASIASGTPFELDMRVLLPEGAIRWIHGRGEISMEDGVAVRLVGMSHDITARKEAEAERAILLAHQKDLADQLRMLLDSTGEGMFGVDGDGICTFMNKAGASLLGGVADSFIGEDMHQLIHHTHANGSKYHSDDCPILKGISTGQPASSRDDLAWRLDGASFPVEYSSYPIHRDGTTDGAVVAFQDISSQLGMEEELRRSEKLFKGAFDAAQTGIAITSRLWGEGKAPPIDVAYLDVNQALCEMLGYSRAELLDLNWKAVTHPDDVELSVREVSAFVEGPDDVKLMNNRFVRKDGGVVWSEVSISKVHNADGALMYYVSHVTDVTKREEATLEQERLKTELVQAQKMEAVGQLAGGIAHDFNNILSVILNYAAFAKEGLEVDDARLGDIQQITKAGEKAATLVHQLLAFSRKEIVEARAIDLNQVITGIYEMLARSLGEDIDLEFEAFHSLPAVTADPGRIEQVLLNLAVNARDAMPSGGVLTISTGIEFVTGNGSPALTAGEYAVVTVSDSGIGMDEGLAERIFEPFFTTKPLGEGTGMGLASAYGIIEQAGGSLSVQSEVGVGTTFFIYLPCTKVALEPAIDEEPDAKGHGIETVLVVEDEDAVRELVTRILGKQGYTVVSFPSGLEALDYTRANSGTIDLLLTDVVMPKMSGKELAERATLLEPDLTTLYMSGYTDELIAQRGVLASGENLIGKPFNREKLLSTVRALLDTKAAV